MEVKIQFYGSEVIGFIYHQQYYKLLKLNHQLKGKLQLQVLVNQQQWKQV